MRTRVTVFVALFACMLVACNLLTGISNLNFNESGDGGSGAPDSSTVTTPDDGGTPSGDAGSDTGSPTTDSSAPLGMPTLLVSGATLGLQGVTDDGYIIYGDTTTSTLYAIASSASASTTPTTLGTADLKAVSVLHNAVLFYGTSTTNRVGPLYVWESTIPGGAAIQVATQSLESDFSSATTESTVAVSADSTHLLYYDGVNAAGTTGMLYLYSMNGGQELVGPINVAEDTCVPRLRFSGSYALASYCTVGGAIPEDAGANIATVSSWDTASASPAPVTVAANVQPVFGAVETGGDFIVGFNENGLYSAPTSGGGPTVTLDPTAYFFYLVSGGAAVVYTTSADALRRTPTAMAQYTTLVASGFTGLKALSSNDKWIVGYKNKASTSSTSDLYAASTTTAGTPVTLTTATTATIGTGGDSFTADSSYALYQANFAGNLGTLTATALGSGASRTIASSNYVTRAVSGTVIVFSANYANGSADIQTVDVASSSSPVTLATGADPFFVITYAKDKFAYTVQGSGLYVEPTPGVAPAPATCSDAGLPAYKPLPAGTGGTCSATDISLFYTDCLASSSTTNLCASATQTIGTSCSDCLVGVQGNSTVWGALVATTGDVFVNVGGCYLANVGSTAQACATAYEAYTLCVSTACGDVSDGGVTNCVESAAATGGQCSCQLSAANTACAPFASSPCASTTDDFQMLFTETATQMCQ
jgi:hypothetical protein